MRSPQPFLLGAALCVLLAGCGGEEPAVAPAPLPLPEVEPLPIPERVAYALERLERGPLPVAPLPVESVHRRNLELAEDDLLALEEETQRQLAEPEHIARVIAMARANADPWHNVLRVLLGMKPPPPDLVLAWTRPVPEQDLDLPTLRLEAVRVLAVLQDARASEVLLPLFEREPANRELGAMAFTALVRLGGSGRERALDVALTHGGPGLWSDVWSRVGSMVPPGESDPALADTLAWWSALAAGSGPRLPTELPVLKSHPWAQARLATDPEVPGVGRGLGVREVYGPLPAVVSHGSGWYATDLAVEAVMPLIGLVYTGKLPAAEARCVLAGWGHAPYRAAVGRDVQRRAVDEGLYFAARHCLMTPGEDAVPKALDAIERQLDAAVPWTPERVRELQRQMGSVSSCDDPRAWDLLARVLFDVRPMAVGRPAIERAYELMQSRPQDLTPLVAAALESDDAERAGIAMHLVRRSRDPVYLDALEHLLDAHPGDEQQAGAVRRTLIFIFTRGYGIPPERYGRFIERYLGWLQGAERREFPGLATGLLDLEEAGEAAFQRGLLGPDRARYLEAWPRDRRIVPLGVAAAALEPLDADSDPAELLQVLALAWSSFPAESVPNLEALRLRLPGARRPWVAIALERVAHRAPFRRKL